MNKKEKKITQKDKLKNDNESSNVIDTFTGYQIPMDNEYFNQDDNKIYLKGGVYYVGSSQILGTDTYIDTEFNKSFSLCKEDEVNNFDDEEDENFTDVPLTEKKPFLSENDMADIILDKFNKSNSFDFKKALAEWIILRQGIYI